MTGRLNPKRTHPELSTPGASGLTRRVQQRLAGVILAIGLVLLSYMVVVEDEPGALPLLLVLVGGGWLFTLHKKRAGQS